MESSSISDSKLNILETTELFPWLQNSISNESCDVMFVTSDKTLEVAEVDEDLKNNLLKADALIPSSNIKILNNDETITDEYNIEDVVEEDTCSINEKIITDLFNDAEVEKLGVMIISDDMEFARVSKERLNTVDIFDNVEEYVFEEEIEDDLVLNEINANLPDILLCSFASPLLEKWIINNKNKMNVRLCIGLSGNIGSMLLKKATNITWITRLFSKQKVFGL